MIKTQNFTTKEEGVFIKGVRTDYQQMMSEYFDSEFIERYAFRWWDFGLTMFHADFKETDVVLDVGGGCSFFMAYLSKFIQSGYIIDNGSSVPGSSVPFFEEWLEMMPQFKVFQNGQIELIVQNAASLPFKDRFFDKVVTFSALEHFEGEDDTLCAKEIYRVLKDDGIFIGTVDFNPISEQPRPKQRPETKTYTYESLYRRIINPANFSLSGEAHFVDPIPDKVSYIATVIFFKLFKRKALRLKAHNAPRGCK